MELSVYDGRGCRASIIVWGLPRYLEIRAKFDGLGICQGIVPGRETMLGLGLLLRIVGLL